MVETGGKHEAFQGLFLYVRFYSSDQRASQHIYEKPQSVRYFVLHSKGSRHPSTQRLEDRIPSEYLGSPRWDNGSIRPPFKKNRLRS